MSRTRRDRSDDATDPALPSGSRRGPLGRRMIARLLDTLVIVVPCWVFVAAVVQPFADRRYSDGLGSNLFAVGVFYVLLAVLIPTYEILFVGSSSATPGKHLLTLKIVREGSGEALGWHEAAIRPWVPILFFGVPVAGPIGPLVVVWSVVTGRNYRGWYDELAGTVVVDTRTDPVD